MDIKDPLTFLMDILTIIDFKDDKHKFTLEFIDLSTRKAIINCTSLLDDNKRIKLDAKLRDKHDIRECVDILSEYISQADYEKQLEKTSAEMLEKYILQISPVLTKIQLDNLRSYLNKIN